MKTVIQRVKYANVTVDSNEISSIDNGLLILLGVGDLDEQEDADWLADKISKMRIFSDGDGKMNLSVLDNQGSILVISQFTLFASTKKGNRPSFISAARPDKAVPLYRYFCDKLAVKGIEVKRGIFGADMKVSLLNDGPVTIVMDSKNRN